MTPSPPWVCAEALPETLASVGHAVLPPLELRLLIGADEATLRALTPSWADLPPDNFLRDGGRYRRRRHSCFVVTCDEVRQVPHRAHWQPVEYNALHGGIERLFEPMLGGTDGRKVFESVVESLVH